MILEFKPKKRPSVGSKKCKPYFNQDCYLRRKNIANVEISTGDYKELKQKKILLLVVENINDFISY